VVAGGGPLGQQDWSGRTGPSPVGSARAGGRRADPGAAPAGAGASLSLSLRREGDEVYVWTHGPAPDQCRNCGWTPEQHNPRQQGLPDFPAAVTHRAAHPAPAADTVHVRAVGIVWAARASTGNQVLDMAPPDWKPPPVEQRRPDTAPGG
jgi:hypothetical protein